MLGRFIHGRTPLQFLTAYLRIDGHGYRKPAKIGIQKRDFRSSGKRVRRDRLKLLLYLFGPESLSKV